MRRGRSRRVDAVLLVVWMVFWTAAILVAAWMLGSAALEGEVAPAVFLAVWLAAAGFGLASAARRLVEALTGRQRQRPNRRRWDDGMDPPEGGSGA